MGAVVAVIMIIACTIPTRHPKHTVREVAVYIWLAGWIDRSIDGWIGGWMDEWVDGYMDTWINGWMDRWMDGLMGGWVH